MFCSTFSTLRPPSVFISCQVAYSLMGHKLRLSFSVSKIIISHRSTVCRLPLFREINRGGQAQLIFESTIAIPQLEGSTSAIAIPQLLKKCCSAIATPQFRNRNFFWSPQLQVRNLRASLPQFLAHFWPRNPVDSRKKILEVKSHATVPLRQVFCFQRNRQF
jgi:hypothetical protein